MAVETERKFLVSPSWRPPGPGTPYLQGYLVSGTDGATVRARIAGDKAFLTVKGPSAGASRLEFEYPIPVADAEEMLKKLARGNLVEKTRHLVEHAGRAWEVDVFHGTNDGLVVAEIELSDARENFEIPEWAVLEVTEDRRYANAYLSVHPYREWGRKA